MHCNVESEEDPKWPTRSNSRKKRKKASDASPGTTSSDEEFRACTDAFEEEQRSHGMKHGEERSRRGKNLVSNGSGCKLSLETVWAQKLAKDEIKEAAKNARHARAFELQERRIALQERELARQEKEDARHEKEDARQEKEDALKQFEFEERIMCMDTSGMSVGQKKFYKDKQDEIVARRYHTSG